MSETRTPFNNEPADEWGPWIEHDGSGCPVPVGAVVHVVFDRADDGDGEWDAEAVVLWQNEWEAIFREDGKPGSWSADPEYFHIVRYRVRKPRGLAALTRLLTTTPATLSPALCPTTRAHPRVPATSAPAAIPVAAAGAAPSSPT